MLTSSVPTMFRTPRLHPGAAPTPAERPGVSEQIGEHIAEITEAAHVRAAAPAEDLRECIWVEALGHAVRAHGRSPQAVVLASFLLVGENRVGLADLLEAFGLLLVPPVASGWFSLASLRYAFLIASSPASSETPRIL